MSLQYTHHSAGSWPLITTRKHNLYQIWHFCGIENMVYFRYYRSFAATILLTLIAQSAYTSNQIVNEGQNGNIFSLVDKQNHRIQLLKLRNVRWHEEMNFLKIGNSQMRNKMDQLNEKLNEILLQHSNCEPYKAVNTAADVLWLLVSWFPRSLGSQHLHFCKTTLSSP